MKTPVKFLWPLLALIIAFSGTVASALPASKPLVIIRFNQPRVHFERSLYHAVSKAVEVKPTVQFTIVSIAPASGDHGKAESNLNKVLQTMAEMGVPGSRVSVRRESDPVIDASEVQIFVR